MEIFMKRLLKSFSIFFILLFCFTSIPLAANAAEPDINAQGCAPVSYTHLTWGLAHILTKDILCGIESIIFSIFFGVTYLLLRKIGRAHV